MPDRTKLRVGDRIRLLCVPPVDLERRERELRDGVDEAGLTADTIERILALEPVVTISHIDDWGNPWFDYELPSPDGQTHLHSIAIMEDESWCRETNA
jgi:hypothetical protein